MKKLTKIQAWSLKEVRRIVFKVLGKVPADVYLFGSWTRYEIYPSSDMDIAILPRGRRRVGLVAEVQEALEESTVPYRVEVVDMSTADRAFRDRILREGVKWNV